MSNQISIPDKWPQHRSGVFMLATQSDAICGVLRHMLATRNEAGPESRRVVQSIRQIFTAQSNGETIAHLPEIGETISTPDLFLAAELLRATIFAFLTPEDVEARSKLGFHAD